MSRSNQMPLRPYLEKITSLCESLSQKDLLALIISLAKDVSSDERTPFLAKLESRLPGAAKKNKIPKAGVDALIARISDLEQEISERIESIEDGSYWEYADEWEDGYDDEVPDDLTEEHTDDLRSLFREAGTLFVDGFLEDAQRVYTALFALIGRLEKKTHLYLPGDLELREARARYCRCLYHAGGGGLTEDFIQAMETGAPAEGLDNSLSGDYPLIQDVIDARAEEMKNLASFLSSWRDYLSRQEIFHNRTADLLLEVVFRLDGLEKIGILAGTWKSKQPRGYIFWLRELAARKEWKKVIEISRAVLEILSEGEYRERVAEFLMEAASASNDAKHLLMGKRERFFSNLCDENLKGLLEEAIACDAREKELETALKFIDGLKSSSDLSAFRVRLLLMSGRVSEAFDRVKHEPGLGWSTGNAGIVFGSILAMAADHSDKAVTVQKLLKGYAERLTFPSFRIVVDDSKHQAIFYREIVNGLKKSKPTDPEMEKMFSWAVKIGEKRITGIVSNKHRNAYDRAAQVLGCLAEAMAVAGKKDKAKNLLQTYYSEKFNRHSAFRREVKQVVNNSQILSAFGSSL